MSRNKKDTDLGEEKWTMVIRPTASFFQVDLKELFEYKDLILLFVNRDYKTMYKQTILGPLWILLKPLMTTGIFTIIFGRIASISTDGIPEFLFFMAGNIMWSYFSSCIISTSNTFLGNSRLFGKVYFPRMVIPVSQTISKLITFGAQFILFLSFVVWYMEKGYVHLTIWCIATPILLLELACLAMGVGMIVASFTTKYRDLQVLVGFGVQLWMYATPIVYPLSIFPQKWRWILFCNPVTSVVECFRYGWLGGGNVLIGPWIAGWAVTLLVLLFGILAFNRVQRNFMDTI